MILYILLYYWTEGHFDVDEKWYKFRVSNLKLRVEYSEACGTGDASVSHSPSVANPRSWSYSYPLAYSFVVLPISVARWSHFTGRHVPSAATFFAFSMYNLSGAINVFLLLTARPQLLLLIRPDKDELGEPEIVLALQNSQRTGDAILPKTANYQHSPMPTTTALVDCSGDSAAVSRVSSRRISVDV